MKKWSVRCVTAAGFELDIRVMARTEDGAIDAALDDLARLGFQNAGVRYAARWYGSMTELVVWVGRVA